MLKPLNPVFQKPKTVESAHDLARWVEERLEDLLGNDQRKREIIDTLLLLDGDDLQLYAKQQLGVDGKMLHFAKELGAHKRRLAAQAQEEAAERARKQRPLKASDPSLELYMKPALEDEPPKKGKGKKKGGGGGGGNTPGGVSHPTNVTVTLKPSKKGGRALKEGVRLACDCQAQEHALISNCLECGRIICMQEGRGPCLFCGSDVETQHLVQQQRSEESAKAREGFFKALAQRNQLVEYDRNSTQRTMVYDDQADYFSTNNSWLSETEREFAAKKEAEKAAKEGKRTMKLAFDFAGRRVMLSDDKDDEPGCDAENFLLFKNERQRSAAAPDVVPVVLSAPRAAAASSSPAASSPYASALKANLPAAPSAPAATSTKKKGKKAARERVQHEYYAGEEDETAQQAEVPPPPFKLCGTIEALRTPWSMADRKQLLDLMAKHRMNHYFYAPIPADLANDWKAPFAPDTLKMLGELIKLCAERGIDFNFALHLPATFDAAHALQKEHKGVATKLAQLSKAGCTCFTFIFADGDAANAPIAEGGKNLGVLHAEALNALFAQLKQESGGKHLHFFVGPAHRHGDLQSEKTLPKKHLYYWRDVNANLAADAAVLFHGPEPLNERITHHFAAAMWQYWGAKRRVVLWDLYASNEQTPQAVFLQPYEGRAVGLENYLHGAVCSVMQQPRLSLVPLATAFAYLHTPLKYVPLKTLKEALLPVCGANQRVLNDLLTLIAICPSPVAPTELSETAARFLKGAAPAAVAEVETALSNAKSASYAPGVREELAPFFEMCGLIIELNAHKHALRALVRQEELESRDEKNKTALLAVGSKIEAEQGHLMRVQRHLDQLLWRKQAP